MTSEMTPSGNLRFHVLGLMRTLVLARTTKKAPMRSIVQTSQNRCNHGQIYNAHHVHKESQTSLLYREY